MNCKNKLLYFVEFSCLLLLLIFASLIYLSQKGASLFFNSDLLLFPGFFKDIFLNHNHYKDWFLSPAPHFFPDMVLYFPTIFFSKNVYFQFLIYIWLVLLLSYFVVKSIYIHFFSTKKTIFFALISIISISILALRFVYPYMLLLVPDSHAGEVIIGLLIVSILFKLVSNKKFNSKSYFLSCIVAILIFASSVSDLLFIIQFVVPFFLSYTFLYIKRYINSNKFLWLGCLCIIPGLIGGFSSKYLVPHQVLFEYLAPSINKISFNSIGKQLLAFIDLIKNLECQQIGIFILFYLIIFITIGFLIFKKIKLETIFNKKIIFLIIVIFFSIIINIIILSFGSNPGLMTHRYFLPLFFFPYLLFFLPTCFLINIKNISTILFTLLLIASLLNSIKILVNQKNKPITDYYPEEIKCFDNSLTYESHGIAEYWDANVVTVLSKKKIEVVPVNVNLEPVYWEINSTKFSKPSSFVILSHINPLFDLNQLIVNAIYGNPEKIIHCGNKKLLIYQKNSIKTVRRPLFGHSGDALNWPAAALPSLIPTSKIDDKRIAKSGDVQNFISYGPYILLPAGGYHFYIKYSSDAIHDKQAVAYYDVYSRTTGIVSKKFIYGSKGKINAITGKFKVTRIQSNKCLFEIRVFYLGQKKFILEAITLVKD
jgi:hypothetical protein